MSFTSTFLVEIDGRPLPADVALLLTSALVDDSQRFPTCSSCASATPPTWC